MLIKPLNSLSLRLDYVNLSAVFAIRTLMCSWLRLCWLSFALHCTGFVFVVQEMSNKEIDLTYKLKVLQQELEQEEASHKATRALLADKSKIKVTIEGAKSESMKGKGHEPCLCLLTTTVSPCWFLMSHIRCSEAEDLNVWNSQALLHFFCH